ncbi:MAG: SRPBCC family protein [Streptosporangiaceae bacterium]
MERTVDTKARPEAVAAFLTDFTTAEQWDPGTVSCRRQDASGPEKVGTSYENVSEFRGRKTTLIYRIVDLDPGRRVRLVGDNKTIRTIDDLTFEPRDGGTRVIYKVDFVFKGLARLAAPFVKGSLNKLCDDGAAQMRKTLDGLNQT